MTALSLPNVFTVMYESHSATSMVQQVSLWLTAAGLMFGSTAARRSTLSAAA